MLRESCEVMIELSKLMIGAGELDPANYVGQEHTLWLSRWLEESTISQGLTPGIVGIYAATPCVVAWYDFLNWCAGTEDNPNVNDTRHSFERTDFDREMRKRFNVVQKSGIHLYVGLAVEY